MDVKKKYEVAIIGSGITGLVIAFYLKKANIDFIVIEKDCDFGGVMQTRLKNGYVYEKGPNTGIIAHPEVVELFEDINDKNCVLEKAQDSVHKRLIYKKKRWHPLPSTLGEAIGTPLFSLNDKIRMVFEPFRKKGVDPHENLASMVKRRLGKSVLRYAVDPFILGIYGGDPEYLVPKYALPKLYELEQEHGSFIRGAINKKMQKNDPRQNKATREVFSVRGGFHQLTTALFNLIADDSILFTCDIKKLEPIKEETGFNLSIYSQENNASYDIQVSHMVTTIGAPELPSLLTFVDKQKLKPLTDMVYAPIVEVTVGFKEWRGMQLGAFGGLIPSIENRKILGVLFMSSLFQGRAPICGALLSVFLGGVRNPGIVDEEDEIIIKIVKEEIIELLEIKNFQPDLFEIHRYPHAIPQYGSDSKERFETINKLQETYPGLLIAGNIKNGIGVADRIKQGKEVADFLIKKVF